MKLLCLTYSHKIYCTLRVNGHYFPQFFENKPQILHKLNLMLFNFVNTKVNSELLPGITCITSLDLL